MNYINPINMSNNALSLIKWIFTALTGVLTTVFIIFLES